MRAVAKLEKAGLITSELTAERSTNTYTMHMEKLVAVSGLIPAKKKGKTKKLNGKTYTRKERLFLPMRAGRVRGHICRFRRVPSSLLRLPPAEGPAS